MNKCKIATSITMLSVAVTLALAGCAGGAEAPSDAAQNAGLPKEIADSGKLRVGLSADFPPMEFKDGSNKLVGMDIDLQQKLGEILGVQIEVVESPFDQLINSIQTNRVDVVISMLDTVERQKTVDFVDYFKSQGRLYTSGSRAAEFTKQTDICGKKLAVSGATDYYQKVKALSKTACADKGLPEINILTTDTGTAARLQIEQGRVDLAAQGAENLTFFMKQTPGKYEPVLEPLPSGPFGIVVAKDSTELAKALQDALATMKSSGDYQKILDKWGLGYGAMDPSINSVK